MTPSFKMSLSFQSYSLRIPTWTYVNLAILWQSSHDAACIEPDPSQHPREPVNGLVIRHLQWNIPAELAQPTER